MILRDENTIREYTSQGWWGDETWTQLLARQVANKGDAIAVVDPLNRAEFTDGVVKRLTWSELGYLAENLATHLIENGIGNDDIVVVQLPNIVELVALFFAAAKVRCIVSPIPVQFREYEIEQIVNQLKAKAFITAARIGKYNHAEMIANLRAPDKKSLVETVVDTIKREDSAPEKLPSRQTIFAFGENVPEGVVALDPLVAAGYDRQVLSSHKAVTPINANEIITIVWTSGTEGKPKGVPRSYNDWLVPGLATSFAADPRDGWHILNPFPLVNMAGIGGMFMPWLLNGGKMVLHQPFSMPTFLQQIATEQIEFTVAPPALLNMLLQKPEILAQAKLDSLKVIGSGSAPLSPWMVKTWQEQYKIPVINYFGSNEGITIVGSHHDIPDPELRAVYFPRFGAQGFTWANAVGNWMKTKLVRPDGSEITEPGEAGEMCVWGPAVMAGYFNAPDMTAKAIDSDGYYHTGDAFEIADVNGEKKYYKYVGRIKDIINRGGMKISSEEVESLLQAHPAVAEVAVVPYPDDILGEKVCAVVVPRPNQTVTLEDLNDLLKEKGVAHFKYPERIMIVDALPRNPVGKILKRELREKAASE